MIFLIDYNRRSGRIITLRSFEDSVRHEAADARLALELELSKTEVDREVVLLDAANQDALMKTHARYFSNINDLASAFETAAKEA